jgi:hypothetical protein
VAREPRFADLPWQSRWNSTIQEVVSTQDGATFLVTSFFGSLSLDLRKIEDVNAVARKARAFADEVERAGREFQAQQEGT